MRPTLLVAIAVVVVACGAALAATAARVPSTVPIHFRADGAADAWVDRAAYWRWLLAVLLGVPLLTVGMLWATRWLPSSAIHVPGMSAAEIGPVRSRLDARLLAFGIELALAQVALLTVLHLAIVGAGSVGSIGWVPWAAGALLVVVAVWRVIALLRDVRRLAAA